MSPLSDQDLQRLERERAEADRRYNDALTRLDAALPGEPALPPAPPPIDDSRATALSEHRRILPEAPPVAAGGLRGRLSRFVWRMVAPIFDRQQQFNEAVVDDLDRRSGAERASREALAHALVALRDQAAALAAFQSKLIQYLQEITPYVDTKDRALAATVLRDPHEQARAIEASIGMLQQQVAVLKREVQRSIMKGETTGDVPQVSPEQPQPSSGASATAARGGGAPREPRHAGSSREEDTRLTSHQYLSFEDQFRGTQDQIRTRFVAYRPLFEGASDVLDVGCGRGEFLELLRERGISGRGLELNHEMVEVCRARGLEVTEGDAVGYLEGLPDGALGGLFAGQVVEHLEPGYLMRFLELAYLKLRPGSKIVLETINVDSWSAFFGPYLRDITHVRPLPPETLTFLLRASGFQRVDTRASSPMGDEAKLARLPITLADAAGPGTDALVTAFNQNVDRLNALLFGFTDYAAIGERL